MSEIRCVFLAHYKTAHINFCELGQFEQWLPENEAYRLKNDNAGRERLFRLHYPTATQISGTIAMEIYEKR